MVTDDYIWIGADVKGNSERWNGWHHSRGAQTYSKALLLGVNDGIAFGYFTFEYKGILPHMAILARNTFDPFAGI
jgi:hypothetical protein